MFGGLPYTHHLPDGEGEAGRGPPVPVAGRWRGGGDGITTRTGRGNPSRPGEGVTWLDSERLALAWQSVGRKEGEERGTGRRNG